MAPKELRPRESLDLSHGRQSEQRGWNLQRGSHDRCYSALAQAGTMGAKGLGSSENNAVENMDFTNQFVRRESDDEAAAIVASSFLQKLPETPSMAVEDINVTRPIGLTHCWR